MTELIRGQRSKINGLYDDPINLTIVESEELCDVLDSLIKPINQSEQLVSKLDEKLIAVYEKEAAT
jgi:hypothetical protein